MHLRRNLHRRSKNTSRRHLLAIQIGTSWRDRGRKACRAQTTSPCAFESYKTILTYENINR